MGEEGDGLIGGAKLSLVLGNEVVEGIGFGGEVVVFSIELALEGVSVLFTGSNEVFCLLELLFRSGEFSLSQQDLSLEISVFSIELGNSVCEILLGFVFVADKLVEGVNKFVSEVVESGNDLGDGTLVGEVLFSCKEDECLHEWGEGDVVLELVLDVLEVALDLLDLEEGWVGELGQQSE